MRENDEPQGCLALLLRFVGIRFNKPDDLAGAAGSLPYRCRDDFLSPAELSFYRVLQTAVGERCVICPKVNLADLFYVGQGDKRQTYRNKIDRKHVDFLLCDPRTMRPLAGVELDDASHSRSDRQARDLFVGEVFEAAGLPLVRVPAQRGYSPQELTQQLAALFARPVANAAAAVLLDSDSPPTCPKCGVEMVPRTAAKGPNAGTRFWGCPNFPKCREIG